MMLVDFWTRHHAPCSGDYLLLCLGCGGCCVGTVLDDEAERDPDDPTAMRNAVESTYPCPGLSPLYRSRSRAIWISLGLGA